ncbi:hypothetical protein C8F01DRAFT_1130042 [Mycena amicta]|nr:hypothetical protein C8F01DRAFT_1130042 [Mycena amicta]
MYRVSVRGEGFRRHHFHAVQIVEDKQAEPITAPQTVDDATNTAGFELLRRDASGSWVEVEIVGREGAGFGVRARSVKITENGGLLWTRLGYLCFGCGIGSGGNIHSVEGGLVFGKACFVRSESTSFAVVQMRHESHFVRVFGEGNLLHISDTDEFRCRGREDSIGSIQHDESRVLRFLRPNVVCSQSRGESRYGVCIFV